MFFDEIFYFLIKWLRFDWISYFIEWIKHEHRK